MSALALLSRLREAGVHLRVEGDVLRYSAAQPLEDATLRELREHKAELIALLGAFAHKKEPAPGLSALPPTTDALASFAQERLLYLDTLHGQNASYNLTSVFELEGELELRALRDAVGYVVERHAILRTRFERKDGSYVQRDASSRPELVFEDLRTLEPSHRVAHVEAAVQHETTDPFALISGPHLRLRLLQTEPRAFVLIVAMHHMVSDDASIALFVAELKHAYEALRAGVPPSLPPLALQYRDAAHQLREAAEQSAARELEYWCNELRGAPTALSFRNGRVRPAVQQADGGSFYRTLSSALESRISELCRRQGCTQLHVFLTAYFLLLAKYSGERDLIVGLPSSGRDRAGLESLIGPFINMLAIRAQLPERASLLDVLTLVSAKVCAAMEHAELPFERIVQAVAPPRSASHSPIFQALFALESTPVGIFELAGVRAKTRVAVEYATKYDLTLVVRHHGRQRAAVVKYNRALFEPQHVERMLDHYERVLEQLVSTPLLPVAALETVTHAERQRQIVDWNRTERDYPLERTLHSFFEQQAHATPDRIALESDRGSLSYRCLNQRANQLAHALHARGVRRESLVAICCPRSPELLIALLGVMKAGAAYVPIDPEYPDARKKYLLDDSGAQLVLTYEHALATDLPTLDLGERAWRRMPESDPHHGVGPDDACYVIYTSGSTGAPKGVLTDHRAICNNLLWMNDDWPLADSDALLLKSPFSFDVSLKEMMWPLMAGAKLVVASDGGQRDPAYLQRTIARHRVTVAHLVPSMLEYFLREDSERAARSLRILMCGGEALSPELKERFCDAYDAGLLHLYGPTEAAIAVTGCLLRAGDGVARISLGGAMPNCQLYAVDDDMQLAPVGIAGELLIGGTPLARGYVGRPRLTAERFVPDPFSSRPGARLYRTGDLVRSDDEGCYTFIGRVDRQIKLRGLRIELGEIEAALRAQPGVAEAAVVVRSQPAQLVAYAVAKRDAALDERALLAALRARLPAHMVPASVTMMPSFPVSHNGKVDVGALPLPAVRQHDSAHASTLEREIARVWCEVLGRAQIGRDDNFFEVGGHSLLAVELQQRLRDRLSLPLAVSDIFLHPTVAALAQHFAPQAAPKPVRLQQAEAAPIAIVGLACRLPDARGPDAFFANLLAGRDSIRFFDERALEQAGVPESLRTHPRFVPARGVIDDVELFDAEFFGFSDKEAELIDPQIRLLLECAQEAFDDAGCDPRALQERTDDGIGVFVSTSRSSYFLNALQHRPDLLRRFGPLQIAMVTDKAYAATQLAYRFDLHGPALAVDTACSSSLVAVHQACRSLANGECSAALVGGASIDVPVASGYIAEVGNIGSPNGRCRPFSSEANGTVKGAGAALIVLKRLDDAIRDRDRIYALIRGSAINNDGSKKVGFTAPGGRGQERVLRQALANAEVAPETVAFVEAHGTGTTLGDPVELASLRAVFGEAPLRIGAVKANIGHLDAAAGIAGLIKTTLALAHGVLPPQPAHREPCAELAPNFRVLAQSEAWPHTGAPRRAGVSSFGIGGTNAHVVLEEAPPANQASAAAGWQLLPLSASSPRALEQMVQQLEARITDGAALEQVSATLCTGRRELPVRTYFVLRSGEPLPKHEAARAATTRPKLVFLFPGQGVRLRGAAYALHREHAGFRRVLDQALAELPDSESVREILLAPESDAAAVDTDIAQPALCALSRALVACLAELGVRADEAAGHSVGELSAAATASVLSWSDASAVAVERGRLMQACDPGGMLAVQLSESELRAELASSQCELAAINGGGQCVVAGRGDALTALEARLAARGVGARRLASTRAFHSSAMEPAANMLQGFLARVPLHAPQIPLSSNVDGAPLDAERARSPSYWAEQVRQPVRFGEQLEHLLADPSALFIELGPEPVLRSLLLLHPRYQRQPVLCAGERGRGLSARSLLALYGKLWQLGAQVELAALHAQTAPRVVSLPAYPFQRTRCWIEPAGMAPGLREDDLEPAPAPVAADELERRLIELARGLLSERELGLDEDFFAAGGNSLLASQFMAEVERALGLRVALSQFYQQPTLRQLAAELRGKQSSAPLALERDQLEL